MATILTITIFRHWLKRITERLLDLLEIETYRRLSAMATTEMFLRIHLTKS
jgi:hypothetical protein